jgi:hypothetical protein
MQGIKKEEGEGEYMKRELVECFKLFRDRGTTCCIIRRKRWRSERSICKVK